MKKAISILAITLVIATLVLTSATGALQHSSPVNEENVVKNSNSGMKVLPQVKMHKQFVSSEKIEVAAQTTNLETKRVDLSALSDSDNGALEDLVDAFHPTMADAGNDNVLMGYEFDYQNLTHPTEDFKSPIWHGSNDDGGNWSDGLYWVNSTTQLPLETSYPSSKYWGVNDTNDVLHATVVAEPGEKSAQMMLMTVEGDPTVSDSYSAVSWDWSSNDFSDMKAATIACDDSQNTWEYGVIGMVMDYSVYSNTPCCSYADPDDSQMGWISYFSLGGCRTTGCAIDGEDAVGQYPVYVAWDIVYGGNDSILFMPEYFDDWHGDSGWVTWWGPEIMLRKPCVEASESHFVMLTEFWIYDDINDTYDKDVVAWHYNYSNPNHVADFDLHINWVGGTIWDETTPAIQHVEAMTYVATFVLNNTLYACKTENGGVNWSDPINISTPDFVWTDDEGPVVPYQHFHNFRNADIAELRPLDMTVKVIWGYDVSAKATDTFRLHWLKLGVGWPGICGDYNVPGNQPTGGDGVVNIADLTFIIAYLYGGGPSPNPLCAADMNGDDAVNIADLTYIIAYLYGGGPNPVAGCCSPIWGQQ